MKFFHDESTMQIMFAREMPMLLQDWRRMPEAERQPLRLRHLAPMQVLAATSTTANSRAFTVSSLPLTPVAASLAPPDAPVDVAAL